MYVGDNGHVFIEKRHPVYPHVIDFLVSCCEPVSRTEYMEQYRLDRSSLSAASAEGTYSTDMIRNILLYFRQDTETGMSFLELPKLAALEAWAASREAEVDCTSYLRCLQSFSEKADGSPESRTVASRAATDVKAAEVGGEKPLVRVKSETRSDEQAEEAGPVGPLLPVNARRLLSLRHRRPPSSSSPTTACDVRSTEAEAVNTCLKQRPLVSLAARTAGWTPAPLPATIEQALAEEATSSKVRIVLQPRLRRFTEALSLGGALSPAHHTLPRGEEPLYYFVVSSDREQLVKIIASSAKQYLEPVVLHGTARWILSDVDRGAEEDQAGASSGRPATLRRLYATGACAVDCLSSCESSGNRRGRSAAVGSRLVYKAQVKPGQLRSLKDALFRQLGIRADCFYDHLQDPTLHVDGLRLSSNVRLRPYQTASLERFQRGDKAHQGVVVLPCGAGKTLTGIGAAAIMRKRTIVMCINNMSVFQWQREFLRWTNLTEDEVTVCTAKEKAMPGKVFITTYSMLVAKRGQAVKGAAARESEEILHAVRTQTWGLLLLDEVHTAVARNFQKVLDQVRYKCVLGLSATLLREDDRIDNLRHLVGPKLYEANWLDLTRAGYLARAECAEVQCPMPASFYARYTAGRAGEGDGRAANRRSRRGLNGDDNVNSDGTDDDDEDSEDSGDSDGDQSNGGAEARGHKRRRRRGAPGGVNALARTTASCNPFKLWCTQALLEFHRNRSPPDKVIIFCDYLADVRFYAYHLHLPFMDQRTSESERTNLLRYFQFSDTVNAIILTRVGDVALDLPCASVIIQISGLGGSQRQEAQRLGRILRPKPPSLDNTCSYFYTLVSQGTHEVEKSYRRQRWLRDQGFACRVLRCELVLREYGRMGGQLCCVGPPQWWYHVPHPAPSPSPQAGAERCKPSSAEPVPADGLVEHQGSWWAPFSGEASARLQHCFNGGKPGCVLEGAAHLGPSTRRPPPEELGGMALGYGESWAVEFSSANAPHTFGTVVIGEAPLTAEVQGGGFVADPSSLYTVSQHHGSSARLPHSADETHARVRRITFGQLRRPHNCLDEDGPCLGFALSGLNTTVDEAHWHKPG